MSETCRKGNYTIVLARKTQSKRQLGRPWCRWKDSMMWMLEKQMWR